MIILAMMRQNHAEPYRQQQFTALDTRSRHPKLLFKVGV